MQVSWLDGVGTPQETWSMLGCFLQSVNYDSGDYAANDPVQITMTIRYDNAQHGAGDANFLATTPFRDGSVDLATDQ